MRSADTLSTRKLSLSHTCFMRYKTTSLYWNEMKPAQVPLKWWPSLNKKTVRNLLWDLVLEQDNLNWSITHTRMAMVFMLCKTSQHICVWICTIYVGKVNVLIVVYSIYFFQLVNFSSLRMKSVQLQIQHAVSTSANHPQIFFPALYFTGAPPQT